MVYSNSFDAPFNQYPQNVNVSGQGWNFGGYGGIYGQPQNNAQGWNNAFGQAALGQAAFGQPQNYGGPGSWNQQFGGQWQQRQLSHHDVNEIVRQLVPFLPQVVAQAQQQPQAAFGFGNPYAGGGFGPNARNLSPQDVNEVVRQILPVIPQIVSLLQGQQPGPYASAIHGGGQGQGLNWNNNQGWNNQAWNNHGLNGGAAWNNQGQYNLFGQGQQNPFNAYGLAAFGNHQGSGGPGIGGGHRQLNQADVGEIVRQLTAALPQVISNLQAINQQQRAA